MSATGELFSVATDPDVQRARAEWEYRRQLHANAKRGRKMMRLAQLQAATQALMRAERMARHRIKEQTNE